MKNLDVRDRLVVVMEGIGICSIENWKTEVYFVVYLYDYSSQTIVHSYIMQCIFSGIIRERSLGCQFSILPFCVMTSNF